MPSFNEVASKLFNDVDQRRKEMARPMDMNEGYAEEGMAEPMRERPESRLDHLEKHIGSVHEESKQRDAHFQEHIDMQIKGIIRDLSMIKDVLGIRRG